MDVKLLPAPQEQRLPHPNLLQTSKCPDHLITRQDPCFTSDSYFSLELGSNPSASPKSTAPTQAPPSLPHPQPLLQTQGSTRPLRASFTCSHYCKPRVPPGRSEPPAPEATIAKPGFHRLLPLDPGHGSGQQTSSLRVLRKPPSHLLHRHNQNKMGTTLGPSPRELRPRPTERSEQVPA